MRLSARRRAPRARARIGQADRGLTLFASVTELSTLSETQYNYASLLAEQNRPAEAREWADRILRKKPTMPRDCAGGSGPGSAGRRRSSSGFPPQPRSGSRNHVWRSRHELDRRRAPSFVTAAALLYLASQPAGAIQQARPLRIIAFGAHPDDAEPRRAVSRRCGRGGHKVKFVAMTNGDVGHFETAGGPPARRRRAEVAECAKILGIETDVLDIHDGELTPSLEHRKTMARVIREWQADIVMGHRPYDYHRITDTPAS